MLALLNTTKGIVHVQIVRNNYRQTFVYKQ